MKSQILKISDAAAIALHTMGLLASRPGQSFRVADIARLLPVSENHLAKVLQRLLKEGLVRSLRGRGGGYALALDPARVTLLQVFEAIEGPLARQGCLLGAPVCRGQRCMLGPLLHSVEQEVREYLSTHRLSDIDNPFGGTS